MMAGDCPVCDSIMKKGLQEWHFECSVCGYEMADLHPNINEASVHDGVNEEFREDGLRSLRNENFEKLLCSIKERSPSSVSLLDVGCAHGWFIAAAQQKGFDVVGIEPDLNIYQKTIRSQDGIDVRNGYFPEVLSVGEVFDVIIFNDVLEHIPDVKYILSECERCMKKGGVLVLNLPSSSGMFYKFSRFLCGVGVTGLFERMWQKGLPSPHLHYFNAKNLDLLLQANGFDLVEKGELNSVSWKGLFKRISYTGGQALIVRIFMFLLVVLFFPIFKVMPSDIIYLILRKA